MPVAGSPCFLSQRCTISMHMGPILEIRLTLWAAAGVHLVSEVKPRERGLSPKRRLEADQ